MTAVKCGLALYPEISVGLFTESRLRGCSDVMVFMYSNSSFSMEMLSRLAFVVPRLNFWACPWRIKKEKSKCIQMQQAHCSFHSTLQHPIDRSTKLMYIQI